MSFDSNTTDYEMTCEQFEARKTNDIVIWMKELLVTVVPLTTQGIYRDQTVITITRLEVWR